MQRRDFLTQAGLGVAAVALSPWQALAQGGGFTLPKLPYAYDALEPHIDAETMKIHHDLHHQAYVDNLNKALAGQADLLKLPVDQLMRDLDKVPKDAAARRRWLRDTRADPPTSAVRAALTKWYGAERGNAVRHAEAFEICEYGTRPDETMIKKLFPFLP